MSAADATTVRINGHALDGEKPYCKNEGERGTYGTAGDYNAYFDVQAGTLTIKDLDIRTYRETGILSNGDLILVLEGKSCIRKANLQEPLEHL